VNKISTEARWSLERVAKDLENARPYDFSNSYPDRSAFSSGPSWISFIVADQNRLSSVTYRLEEPAVGSIYEVLIGRRTKKNVSVVSKTEQENPLNLFVREEQGFIDAFSPSSGPSEKIEKEVLNASTEEGSLRFFYAYFEDDGKEGKMTWKDSWDETYLPAMVRAEMVLRRPGRSMAPVKISRDIFIPTGFLGKEG